MIFFLCEQQFLVCNPNRKSTNFLISYFPCVLQNQLSQLATSQLRTASQIHAQILA